MSKVESAPPLSKMGRGARQPVGPENFDFDKFNHINSHVHSLKVEKQLTYIEQMKFIYNILSLSSIIMNFYQIF